MCRGAGVCVQAGERACAFAQENVRVRARGSLRIAKRDMEIARKLQEEELSDVIDTTDKVVQNWKEPTVEVEEKNNGVLLIVELQGVRRMEVDLDEDGQFGSRGNGAHVLKDCLHSEG